MSGFVVEKEKVSVIMSLYAEPLDWLQKSIDSILMQDNRVFEFIIVNDNPERLELDSFLSDYSANFSNIKVLKNIENLGLIRSLNKAVSMSSGDYIARMDADDVSLPNRLSRQLEYLKVGDFDLIGANVEVIDEGEVKMYDSNKVLTDKYIDSILLLGTVPLVHPTYFGKVEVFKKCKYNENAIYAEDMEFIAHARTLGYKIGNCPDILLKYRFSETSITKSNAYVSYNTALSVKKAFSCYKKTGEYKFKNQIKNINKNKVTKFNNRQISMNIAKKEIKRGDYLKGVFFLFKAMMYDASFFKILYINIMQNYYVHKDLIK